MSLEENFNKNVEADEVDDKEEKKFEDELLYGNLIFFTYLVPLYIFIQET